MKEAPKAKPIGGDGRSIHGKRIGGTPIPTLQEQKTVENGEGLTQR